MSLRSQKSRKFPPRMFIGLFPCLECPLPRISINHQILPEHLLCAKHCARGLGGSEEPLEPQSLSSWHLLLSLPSRWREQAEGKSHKARVNQDTRSGNRNDAAKEGNNDSHLCSQDQLTELSQLTASEPLPSINKSL